MEPAMSFPNSTADYLAELQRVTAAMAVGQRVEDVIDAVTAGLRTSGQMCAVSVSLYLHDGECPVCQEQPPLEPSTERRLHRVAWYAHGFEVSALFHVAKLGQFFVGRAAEQQSALLIEDMLPALEEYGLEATPAAKEGFRALVERGARTAVFLPMIARDTLVGVLTAVAPRVLGADDVRYMEVVATQAATILRNAQLYDEVRALTDRLAQENAYLERAVREEGRFAAIVGTSPALRGVMSVVQRVAATDTTVLLTGETGTGKELIARAIHDGSQRAQQPMIKVNCGAIPPGLIESEFFGHERGAFTGAHQRRIGSFELADRGTLFLDEVGELTPDTQVRLLRVLQDSEFQRVGGSRPIRVDIRLIAATNRNLAADVADGRFRSDLYYRLNVLQIALPPLRERRSDVPALAENFAALFSRKLRKPFAGISAAGMDLLVRYDWPGNIREMQNVIERACVLSHGPLIEITDPAEAAGTARREGLLELRAVEREHIYRVLENAGWRIEGPAGAATLLGVHPSTLRSRMKKLNVARPIPTSS
jgi:formate hydrogenlyase transcriptional activator